MAVIEIAKIQVRRGQENQTGIPALAGGEFAWAADTERLYIGLRRDDGGSRDANVEILTENHLKNFFQVSFTTSTYIYREGSASAVAGIDGITEYGGAEWQRTIQEKLDDIVSVQDFGVYGNGNDWDLDRLQFTIDRLFLNNAKYNIDPAKKLYFPAGTYYITGTVYIPAYTNIIGDGIGKTVFVLTTNTSAMIKTMDSRSISGLSPVTFDSGGFVTTGTARFIQMSDLTLQYNTATTVTEAMSLLSLDCADNSLIRNVEFKGNYTTGTGVLTTSGYVGLNLRGKTENGTHANSVIDNCSFDGLYSGVISNHDIKTITIQNSEFNTLVRGVTFNDPKDGTALVGPTFIKITNNRFDVVEQEAIYVGSNESNTGSYVISQNNFFERVGIRYDDEYGDIGATATAVISFLSDQNSSVNDHFRRALVHKQYINTPLTTYYRPLVDGRTTLDEVFVTTATIYPGNTATTFLRLPITGNSQHLGIKYSAFRQNAGESTATVVIGTINGTTATIDDTASLLESSGVEILVASTVTSVIPVNTIVESVDAETNTITFSNTVTLAATDILVFTSQLDRMGNLGVYLQDSANPNVLVTDDYNFINSDGGLNFFVNVNNTGSYYEISASLNTNTSFGPVITVPVVLEFQNKLML